MRNYLYFEADKMAALADDIHSCLDEEMSADELCTAILRKPVVRTRSRKEMRRLLDVLGNDAQRLDN